MKSPIYIFYYLTGRTNIGSIIHADCTFLLSPLPIPKFTSVGRRKRPGMSQPTLCPQHLLKILPRLPQKEKSPPTRERRGRGNSLGINLGRALQGHQIPTLQKEKLMPRKGRDLPMAT